MIEMGGQSAICRIGVPSTLSLLNSNKGMNASHTSENSVGTDRLEARKAENASSNCVRMVENCSVIIHALLFLFLNTRL